MTQQHEAGELAWNPWIAKDAYPRLMPSIDVRENVEVLRRDGRVNGPYLAGRIEWLNSGTPSDILFWRPCSTPNTEPAGGSKRITQADIELEQALFALANTPEGSMYAKEPMRRANAWRQLIAEHRLKYLQPVGGWQQEQVEALAAKYADMPTNQRANAMADDGVGDPWELLGYFREKLRQAEWETDHARSAATSLAQRLAALTQPSGERP